MVLATAFLLALVPQAPKKKDVDLVDPLRVDQAIKKGVEFLRTAESPVELEDEANSDELLLLTLLHAQVSPQDPKVQELLQAVLEAPLRRTYKVALQAMCLEELDCVKYQKRIYHCAQFLVDNQCRNGQWAYGKPTTLGEPPTGTPTEARVDVASAPTVRDFRVSEERVKPKPQMRLPVKKQRDGPGKGDNSNSQYAALGLRACHEAGILLPKETLDRATAWWRRCQERASKEKEGKDEEDEKKGKKPPPTVATGSAAPEPLGWGYDENADRGEATGSMTAGAIGALVIYNFIVGKDWKADPNVARGLAWMARKFTVTKNPGEEDWHYYYLYGVERAGMLTGLERFGTHPWYSTGAKFLLDAQKPDGSWKVSEHATWDTCFAILFLRRATRPLADVASEDRLHRTPGK